jgi:hypothetical protein
LIVYVENAGDFLVPLAAVEREKLDQRLRQAINHAHDAEEPDA